MSRKMENQLRTVHVPADRKNPYQRALGLGLNRLGVRVKRLRLGWNVLKTTKGAGILHIHWTSAVVNNPLWKVAVGFPFLAAQFLLMRLRGGRVIWTVHNLESHENGRPIQNRIGSVLIGAFANMVIVHGESARRVVAGHFGVPDRKIAVIPHGNYIGLYPDDCQRDHARTSFGLAEGQKAMLFLGHIRPYKGVENLIRSFKNIDEPNAVLIIAGRPLNPAYQGELERLIGGHPRIRFHPGFVADERIQWYMRAADVVVFPYKEILTSGAVLLAMSFGKACIAPSLGCIRDVLDARGAFIYDAGNYHGLEHALGSALETGVDLTAMGGHNRLKAEQWSWDRIAAATLEVYSGTVPVMDIKIPQPGREAAAYP